MTLELDSEGSSWLLGRALGGAAVSVLLFDCNRPDPCIVFASLGFEHLSGYSRHEAVGHGIHLLEGQETARTASDELSDALREARPARVVLQHYRKDGSRFWNDVSLNPLRNLEGRLSHQVCVQRDVTKQIESERALRESVRLISQGKRDWESTVDSLPELVFLVDGDMHVVRANRTIESWELGSVHEIPGRHLHDVLHPHCLLEQCHVLDLWRRLCEGEAASDAIDCNVRDGILRRRVHVAMRASRRGDFDSTIVIVRDVGDVYEKEETRRRRDRFDAMGYLVGGLAHEIGNPIAAMKTTLEVWSRGFEDFDRQSHLRYLQRMQEGVNRLQASVERILGHQQGEEDRTDEIVRVLPLLERTCGLFEDQAREKGIALDVTPIADADTAVLGGAAAIDEVLANVVKNAMEACRSGDRILIDVLFHEDRIMIRVRDSGPGISRSDMEHLFLPFFTTKPTGTGLGLAHVDRLMDEMGGQIEIESAEGDGTTVRLRFRRTVESGVDVEP